MRRRHQNDSRDLIMIFNRRHQRRLVAPLLTRPKPIEQPENQAMLSLTPQEKRLYAFEELPGVREKLYLIGRRHNAGQYFAIAAEANFTCRICASHRRGDRAG